MSSSFFVFCSQDYHRHKGCIYHILNTSYLNPFFIFFLSKLSIIKFRAFRFDWYLYKKRTKVYFFLKGLRGGGKSFADMLAKSWVFYWRPPYERAKKTYLNKRISLKLRKEKEKENLWMSCSLKNQFRTSSNDILDLHSLKLLINVIIFQSIWNFQKQKEI